MGSLFGVNSVLFAIAFSGVMFPGGLAPYLGLGILIGLVGNGVVNIVGALTSKVPYALFTPQDKAGVILGGIGLSFGAVIISNPDKAPYFASNFIAMICIAALFTGLIIYLAGRFKLGRAAQILPYPVISGFLAGTGILMFKAAFVVMLDRQLTLDAMQVVFETQHMMQWLLGLGGAVCLAWLLRKFPTPIMLPLVMGIITLLIYGGHALVPEVVNATWFFQPSPPIGDQWKSLSPTLLDAPFIAGFTPEFLTITLLTMLAGILNVLAIGIALKQDINLDQALKSDGITNVIGGLFGVMAGHTSNSNSTMIYNIGGRTRLIGICCGIVCLIAAGFAPQYADKVPRALPAVILFLFSVNYLYEWLWQAPRNWPLSDRLVTYIIIALVISYDLLTAIGAGLIIATLMFAIRYSRVPIRKSEKRLSQVMSKTEWPPEQRMQLSREGDERVIMTLTGFLFFGSIMRLVDLMRTYPDTVSHVHFDFADVTGADSSATLAMSRLDLIATTKGIKLSQSGLSETLAPFLKIDAAAQFKTLDEATHNFEYDVLADNLAKTITLKEGLGALGIPPAVQDRFTPLDLAANSDLFCQGEESGDIYYLESGSLVVVSAQGAVLRTLRPGVLVGEMARYGNRIRSATIRAAEPSRLFQLSDADIDGLPEDLRASLHEAIARLLTNRLADMTRIMSQSD